MLYDKTEVTMASIFGFAIKALKTFRGRDGVGSQGNIYYNGKKVGWYNDSADGGASDIEFEGTKEQRVEMQGLLKEATRKYYERFPLTGMFADLTPNEEIFMEELVNFTLDEKEFKKYQKDGYIGMATFQKVGEPYKEYTMLFKKEKAIEEFQKRPDIENARVYTKDAFVITDDVPQIQGEVQENPPNMGM
jgi:hypothetical protein